MSPYYAQGNLIYVRPKNTNEILVGDIITYYENSGKKISTRRVIAVENNHEDFSSKFQVIAESPGNTGISQDMRTQFTTNLLLSD